MDLCTTWGKKNKKTKRTIAVNLYFQIFCTAALLSVSLALAAVSLMGLSQGDRQLRGYHVLSRAALPASCEEQLRTPADLEDPLQQQQLQQQQEQSAELSPSVCSINSGIVFWVFFLGVGNHLEWCIY